MSLAGLLADAATDGAVGALEMVRLGELKSMDEVDAYMGAYMDGILDFIMPSAKQEFASLVAPATQQAIDAVKPAMYEVLRDWTPSIASIVGGMAGLAVLLGVWVSRRTFMGTRRRRYS